MSKNRIAILCASIIVVLIAAYVYAFKIEPNSIKLTKYKLDASGVNIRIAHLTDFHVEDDHGLKRVASAISILKDQHPDVIVLTGDYITDFIYNQPEYLKLLMEISSIAPTYAIGGNHDGGFWARQRGGYLTTDPIKQFITQAGIHFLQNETDTLSVKNKLLEIYGSGDLWAGYCIHDNERIFSENKSSIKIVLTHNPDSKFKFMNDKWNLMFCGHTHGGQVVLPFFGAPRLPINNKKYIKGIFDENGQYLIVSSGIGCLHGIRFNSRPEITLLEY